MYKRQEYKGITIELKEVNIHYKDGENVIHRGDFIANAGEITAVVGPSGEGKTTLIRVLLGLLHPMEGRAELKNAEGIKCRLSAGTREFFSYVPQGNTIFAGSIAENMRMVKEDATDEEIYQALDIAQAREFVDQKEQGLDFRIEQNGGNLSGGQKQRLTIARALVRKPEILILDDSASALDFATDARLRKAIKENTENMTVFLVSQRVSTIRNADHILVLDDGKIAGIGTHLQLLKENQVYKEICASQMAGEEA